MNKILGAIGKVFGSTEISGKLIELFKGNKQKQREFELELTRMLNERIGKELKDLSNAREMQVAALAQNDRFSKRFVYYLSAGLLLATILLSILPMFIAIPDQNLNLVNRGTDFFYTVSGGSIIAFFFGAKIKG